MCLCLKPHNGLQTFTVSVGITSKHQGTHCWNMWGKIMISAGLGLCPLSPLPFLLHLIESLCFQWVKNTFSRKIQKYAIVKEKIVTFYFIRRDERWIKNMWQPAVLPNPKAKYRLDPNLMLRLGMCLYFPPVSHAGPTFCELKAMCQSCYVTL